MRRAPVLLLTATTALVLTGCTGGDGDDSPPAAPQATADSATGAATAPAEPDEPLEPATAECLAGTWDLDLPALTAALQALVADSDIEVTLTGSATYEFAPDGGFAADVDTSSDMTSAADGTELRYETTSSGDLRGTWSIDGDQVVVSDVDPGGLEVTRRGELDGEEIDVPPQDGDTVQALVEGMPPTSATASCGESRATLVMPLVEDEDSEPVEITYTLRR